MHDSVDPTAVLPPATPADSGAVTDVLPAAPATSGAPAPVPAPAATSGWPKVTRPATTTATTRAATAMTAPADRFRKAAGPAGTAATDVLRTAVVRDPWQEGGGALGRGEADAHDQHDPHEVTVQLDAVQLGDGVLHRAKGGPGGALSADAADRPVFVDESGRRSRLYRRIGIAVGLACAVYAVVMVVTLLSGSSDAPWLPVPGKEDGKPAGKVDTTPLPTGSVSPSDTGSPTPDPTPSATGVEEQLPDTGASASDTAPATEQSGTATQSESTATGTAPEPGDGETEPGATDTATAPDPDATDPATPTDDTTADPTETTGGDSAGTGNDPGNLAQAPGTPTPLAAESGAPAPDSPLVEYTF
ncbi:hypothetical protein ACTT8P_16660 [Streptomyces sp. JW3]